MQKKKKKKKKKKKILNKKKKEISSEINDYIIKSNQNKLDFSNCSDDDANLINNFKKVNEIFDNDNSEIEDIVTTDNR